MNMQTDTEDDIQNALKYRVLHEQWNRFLFDRSHIGANTSLTGRRSVGRRKSIFRTENWERISVGPSDPMQRRQHKLVADND